MPGKAVDLDGIPDSKDGPWRKLMWKLSDGGGFHLWNVYWHRHMLKRRRGKGWRIGKEHQPPLWYLHRWWGDHGPRATYYDIKTFYQRGTRGWADRDVWGLDSHLSQVIRDSVDRLRITDHGHPADLTHEQWEDILLEISIGMQARLDLIEHNYDYGDKAQELLLTDLHARALDLLKERWFSLWD